MRKMRILLITSMPWREDNNIGNSYSNIFSGLTGEIEFAHIYCRSGMPSNSICYRYFQITEQDLIRNIKDRKFKPGKSFNLSNPQTLTKETFSAVYDKMRILRWEIFFFARNILWEISNWRTKELDKFVEQFDPDIIFGTLTYMPNINKLMVYLKNKFNKPLVTYAWDDVYSLKQYSLSPLYWLRRFIQRQAIRNCVRECSYMYTITELLQREYSELLNIECKMLYKGYKFVGNMPEYPKNKFIKLLFMGNMGGGRWKMLKKIVKSLDKINENEVQVELFIYSLTPRNDKITNALTRKYSHIMDVIPSSEVINTMRSADVLIHVEPNNIKDRLSLRASFSTKLVDYFYSGRCIYAVGGHTASMEYLERYNAAIVEYNIDNIYDSLLAICDNRNKIESYGRKAWECGKSNHNIKGIQKKILEDFQSLTDINLNQLR